MSRAGGPARAPSAHRPPGPPCRRDGAEPRAPRFRRARAVPPHAPPLRAGVRIGAVRIAAGRIGAVRIAAGRIGAFRIAAGRVGAVRIAAGRVGAVRLGPAHAPAVAGRAAGRGGAIPTVPPREPPRPPRAAGRIGAARRARIGPQPPARRRRSARPDAHAGA